MDKKKYTVDSILHAPLHIAERKAAPDSYILVDSDSNNWIIVNSIGKEIISLCNGHTTVKGVTKTLCERHGESYADSVENVLEFIESIKEKDFLREDPFPPPQRIDKKSMNLEVIWLNITNKCNLQCIHCHLSSGAPLQNELTTEEIYDIISQAKELGLKETVISGGEPLLRRDILPILEYTVDYCEKVQFITNGTLITKRIADKLRDLEVDVQVSLDGAREETNDLIRGQGAYRKTLAGFQHLIEAGVRFRVSMTVMKKNMEEIPEMAHLLEKLGIEYLHTPLLQLRGRAQENKDILSLTNEELVTAFKEIHSLSKTGKVMVTLENNLQNVLEGGIKKDLCGAGCSTISVAADGKVYPCAALHEEEFCAGDLRKQKLRDIWEESNIFERFRSLSVFDIPECENCELKFLCGGGCHVDTYAAYGRLDKVTPKCKAQKEIYWLLLFDKLKKEDRIL